MSDHVSMTTVDPFGRVILDHVPFKPGEKVEVTLRSREPGTDKPKNLRGSVHRFEHPFEPVAAKDWEAEN